MILKSIRLVGFGVKRNICQVSKFSVHEKKILWSQSGGGHKKSTPKKVHITKQNSCHRHRISLVKNRNQVPCIFGKKKAELHVL